MPRRLRGGARGAARPPLRDALRPAAQRAPVARPRVPCRRADAGRMIASRPARRWRLMTRAAARRRRHRADRRVRRRSPRGAPASRPSSAGIPTPSTSRVAAERGAVEPCAGLAEAAARAPTSSSSRRRSASCPRAVREVLDRAPDAVHGHGRRLDEGAGLRGRGRRPALRRRPPDLRRRDARARTRHGRAVRRRDLVPHPDGDDRARAAAGSSTASSPSLGARPVAIDPDAHDRLVAVTSHLPHVLANVLLNQAGSARIDGHDPLAGGRRLAARHDADRRRQPADLGRHLPRQPRGARGRARRAAPAARAGRGGARGGRRGLPRPLDRRGERAPAPDARDGVRRPGQLCSGCGSTSPTVPGVLAGIFQALGAERINVEDFEIDHVSHRAGRHAHDARLGRGRGRARGASCSRRRATASSSRR